MSIQNTGVITVNTDPASAFGFVQDPLRMAGCIPGCHDLREIAPGKYSAILTNKVSFITLNFKVTVEITKIEPPTEIAAKVTGESLGLAGRLAATAAIQLAPAADGQTEVRYTTDVGLTGKLGGLGQPVFKAKSVQLGAEFGANLKAAIEGSCPPPTAEAKA